MTVDFSGRREDARLLTGAGRYTSDWSLPDQLHAAFLRSDRAHATITGIDTAPALAAPGVVAVLTGADTMAAGFHRSLSLLPFKGVGGEGLKSPPRTILAHDRVRYVGEPVAIVVANTASAANDAAEQITIDYHMLPAYAAAEAAIGAGAIAIHDGVPGNVCFEYDYGDATATAAAFANAAHTIRLELSSGRVVGNPMEPKAALASWVGDTLDLWTSTQGMTAFRDSLCAHTGLDPEQVRIRAFDVGGGFGIRGSCYPEHVALALAARHTGRPVKWVASRTETFLSDYHGRAIDMVGELALDASGRFTALRHQWLCDQGAYPVATGPLISTMNPAVMCTGCYRIPAVHGLHRLAITNTLPVTAYRGAGRPDMAYMIERLVDEAARRTGIDRLDLRRRNLVPRDAMPYRLPIGPAAEYDSGDYPALLDAVTAEADWAGFESRRAEARARGKLRGIGCAVFVEPAGGVVPKDEVAISFDADGGILLHTVVTASGQGHETVFPEIVARILQLDAAAITLSAGKPEGPVLTGGGAFASRSMMSHGAASAICAHAVVEKGRALAANALEAAEADIDFAGGHYRIVGTDRSIGLLDLARSHAGSGANPLDTLSENPAARAFPSGAHVAEVEIDPDTGQVEIVRYCAVDDCGVVLNHTLLEGQLLGGMVQGLGQVLGEHCRYAEDGQLTTASFMDYVMPHADMLRDISIGDLSVPSPTNILGVKGAGEAGTTGSLPAAINAILDALRPAGVTHLDMPASAMRVWQALQQAVPASGTRS